MGINIRTTVRKALILCFVGATAVPSPWTQNRALAAASAEKLTAIPMEASRSKNAVPADHSSGTADGSRPGHFNVNEWDPEHRLILNVEAIAYHEGIPRHHLQLSLAQQMEDLPRFRRHGGYTVCRRLGALRRAVR